MKHMSERLQDAGLPTTGYDLAMRILDRQLLGLIEEWDALEAVMEQELPYHEELHLIDCQKVLESAMSALVNEAEKVQFITWEEWYRIHHIIMWIGYSAEDRK